MIGKPFDILTEVDCHSRYNRLVKARRDGRYWMLKGLKQEYQTDPVMCELLHKEFSLGMLLRHQGIVGFVSLEHVAQLGGGEFIVQEWVEGVTLKRWLEDEHPWRDKVDVLLQLCDVLDYCHRMNVVHRDIKPSNIMITPDSRVVIIDMGLAVAGNQCAFTAPAGTERYMAPEQRQEGVIVDGRADLYAVGRIMQEMRLPRRFNKMTQKLLQHDREQRYADAKTLREALSDRSRGVHHQWAWLSGVFAIAVCVIVAFSLGRGGVGYRLFGAPEKFAPTLPEYLTADTVNHWATDTAHYITFTADDKSWSYTVPKTLNDIPGNIPEAVAVDLGLKVLWAPFNVGCSRASLRMTGGYYGYGDPTGKLVTSTSSVYWNSVFLDDYSGTEYDIARVQWGGRWRTPSMADVDELISRCQWTLIYPDGSPPGYLVVGPNGNRIFLPLAGFRYEDEYYEPGIMGVYWATNSQINRKHGLVDHIGCCLTLGIGEITGGLADVADGFSVRPVLDR